MVARFKINTSEKRFKIIIACIFLHYFHNCCLGLEEEAKFANLRFNELKDLMNSAE